MDYKTLLVSLLLCAVVNADKCRYCDRSECAQLTYCAAGLSQDPCGCCDICANILGEKCEIPAEKSEIDHGKCGEYLTCAETGNDKGNCICKEVGEVCGTDGKTYSSICELLSATVDDNQLSLSERAPCRTGPIIKSSPLDAIRPIGSILILDCEATGYPVPTITWELNKADGSTVPLPSDDSLVAVQVRGGPEKNMATGWVQIMKILPENVGYYTCIASNSKGQAKASAEVSIKKDVTKENEL